MFMLFALVLGASLITSCSSNSLKGAPLDSLCVLDFEARTCWVNKAHGEGYLFEEMSNCDEGGICWFALSEKDLTRIHSTINKGN